MRRSCKRYSFHGIGRAKSYGCGMLTFRPI
ncbi:type I-E CRISPR-associated protein Cas6/Cse3/CasE [Corynebacterium pseudotuberculosis]